MRMQRELAVVFLSLMTIATTGCGGGGGGSVAATADVQVTGKALAQRVVLGGVARYAMVVTNAGPDGAQDVAITASVDGGQTLSSVTCTASGGAVCPPTLGASMTVAALPKGGSLSFTLSAAAPKTDVGATLAATFAAQFVADPVISNNSATTAIVTTAPNSVSLQSDYGDYIGGGNTYAYSRSNAVIAFNANGRLLNVTVDGDQNWRGEFMLPATLSRAQNGTFANLTRYPFNDQAAGGLSWDGEGRGCNELNGSFSVSNVSYVDGVLEAIDISFEQHCGGGAAALRGQIHWTNADDTTPPGPVNPPPAGLWAPAPGVTPAIGNYVYLQSSLGDYIGLGGSYVYALDSSTLNVTANGAQLSVNVAGWHGDFQAMQTLSQLQRGYYADLRRYPFHNPAKGGLSWYGQGRGCNTLLGWLVVDSVSYDVMGLAAIELRFQQRCEGSMSPLYGKIVWAR